jgi:hypothetical protein
VPAPLEPDPLPAESSTLALDPRALAALLAAVSRRPGAPEMSFGAGRIHLRQDGLTLTLEDVRLGTRGLVLALSVAR